MSPERTFSSFSPSILRPDKGERHDPEKIRESLRDFQFHGEDRLEVAYQQARGQSWMPRNWIHRWRFIRRYQSRMLKLQDLVLEVPETQHPMCSSCKNTCCSGPNLVSLRLSDLARLIEAGLGWAAVTPTPLQREEIYQENPELREIEDRDSFRLFPVLEQNKQGCCVFLDDEKRCSIHSIRPLACRRFPHFLSSDLKSVKWARFCKSYEQNETQQSDAREIILENHNQKLKDLWLLSFGKDLLRKLGLLDYLPGFSNVPAQKRSFAEVLDARRNDARRSSDYE